MKKNLVYAFVLAAMCFASCKKENDSENDAQGTIQIGLSQQLSKLKSVAANEKPASIVISIADSSGKVIIESKQIALFNMNGSYLSEPISITTGNYNFTKFLVLDSANSALYATPLKDSKYAYLVKAPLPITFNVRKDSVTKIVPEVLLVEDKKPEDFGYASFSFDVVKTFDFLTTAVVYNDNIKNWELTSANITIKTADNREAYNGTLAAATNKITLKDNSVSFFLTVSKNGYQSYSDSISATDLKLYFESGNKGPLIIRLSPADSLTVTDVDGNVYKTVKIGTQIWMAENLKVTHYNDGFLIPNVKDNYSWVGAASPARCWFNNDSTNKNVSGAMYNWYAVNTGKLCPAGWHVPSHAEWTILTNYLGGLSTAAGKLKETGTSHWVSPNSDATNEIRFFALPGGYRSCNSGGFFRANDNATWWTSTSNTSTAAWSRAIAVYETNAMQVISNDKRYGISVRCIKD